MKNNFKINIKKLLFVSLLCLSLLIIIIESIYNQNKEIQTFQYTSKQYNAINIVDNSSEIGSVTASSDIFEIEQNSTNSHYTFVACWRVVEDDGTQYLYFLICGDSKAVSKTPESLTIAGIEISEIYRYSDYIVTDIEGNTTTFSEEYADAGIFYLAKLNIDENESIDFTSSFYINFITSAGGFNVTTDASIIFYILVKHDIQGEQQIDWEQSKGQVELNYEYTTNSIEFSGYEYVYGDLLYSNETVATIPNSSYPTEGDSKGCIYVTLSTDVTSAIVTFYYDVPKVYYYVEKVWDDEDNSLRPSEIQVQLYANGESLGSDYIYTLNDENSWSCSYYVQENDDSGEAIVYTVKELDENSNVVENNKEFNENYIASYTTTENKTTITNVSQSKEYNYTVEYYYNGTLDEDKTENLTATYLTQITQYTDKNITNYKLSKTENLPLTISSDESANVIKIYYVLDYDSLGSITLTKVDKSDGTTKLRRSRIYIRKIR